MKTTFWWVVLGCLAVALGLGLAWQRLQLRPLQAELEVLRDQQQEIGRLQVRHAKLIAVQVPEAELQRLRNDRAAITRMRREVETLRAKAELKLQGGVGTPAERFGMGVDMPAAEWRNAGGATAAAALETVLWAAAGGEVEEFAKRIRFDAAARTAALALLQSLPPAERARHASPEALMAFSASRMCRSARRQSRPGPVDQKRCSLQTWRWRRQAGNHAEYRWYLSGTATNGKCARRRRRWPNTRSRCAECRPESDTSSGSWRAGPGGGGRCSTGKVFRLDQVDAGARGDGRFEQRVSHAGGRRDAIAPGQQRPQQAQYH
jgi:hypothetical protein